MDFDFICINLKDRTDRQRSSQELFERLGINVKWWQVERHPDGGMHGCFESHWHIWTSPELTRPYLCVFEDDLILKSTVADWWKVLAEARRLLPEKLDILNLEPGLGYSDVQLGPQIYQGFFLHLGCYIVHRTTRKQLAARVRPLYGLDIDAALYKRCRMGAIIPEIFDQRGIDSDNGGGYRKIRFLSIPATDRAVKARSIRFTRSQATVAKMILEGISLLSGWYLMTQGRPMEFQDRRVERKQTLFLAGGNGPSDWRSADRPLQFESIKEDVSGSHFF